MAKTARLVHQDKRTARKDDVDIGLRIRLRRLELNLSQQKLGEILDVSFQQIQKYERGVNRVSGARFGKICRALQVDPNYLFGWNGKSLKVDAAQTNDSTDLRMAQAINSLPSKVRSPVHHLIRKLGELSPADLNS